MPVINIASKIKLEGILIEIKLYKYYFWLSLNKFTLQRPNRISFQHSEL